MTVPDGYRIYWGTTENDLSGTHPDPLKSHYNSPITVSGGDVTQHTLPSDFWDSSFTTIYFSLAAYSGENEGVRSTPIMLGTCQRTIPSGVQTFCIPLDDGNVYTPKQLVSILGAQQVMIQEGGVFQSYLSFSPNSGPEIKPYQGVVVFLPSNKTITWRGQPWNAV